LARGEAPQRDELARAVRLDAVAVARVGPAAQGVDDRVHHRLVLRGGRLLEEGDRAAPEGDDLLLGRVAVLGVAVAQLLDAALALLGVDVAELGRRLDRRQLGWRARRRRRVGRIAARVGRRAVLARRAARRR